MFRKRSPSQFLLAVSLAAILLFAQWLLVQHGVSLEQHVSSHACEWCLVHVPLQGALPSNAINQFPAPAEFPQPRLGLILFAGEFLPAYATRAPPYSSFV